MYKGELNSEMSFQSANSSVLDIWKQEKEGIKYTHKNKEVSLYFNRYPHFKSIYKWPYGKAV